MTKLTNVMPSVSPEITHAQIEDFIKIIPKMVSRRWILTTFLVFAAMAVMIRLGIWQLDRLEKRRTFNARVLAQTSQPILDLNKWSGEGNLDKMELKSS